MKVFLTFLLALSLSAVLAQTAEEQKVLKLSARKFDWLVQLKSDSIALLLDDKVQYVHSNGWTQNKQEVLDDMRTGKLVYKKVTVKAAKVRLYDKTAIVTGFGTFEGVNGGNAFALNLGYTEVYVFANGAWRLASRHSNRMP